MVFQKRLNYGFNGYQVPPVPRAARSLRRSGPFKKKVVDDELCAFDLLATVAGKILLEGQSNLSVSSNGNVKEEQQHDDGKLVNIDSGDQSSSKIGLNADEHGSLLHNKPGGEITDSQSCFSSGSASVISNSGCLDKIGSDAIKASIEGIASDTCSSEDPNFVDQKPPGLANLGIDVKSYVQENHYECGFPSQRRGSVKIATKDDDENSSRCPKKSTVMRTISSAARITDRRIRRFLASRYWRAPKRAKDSSFSYTEPHSVYHTRKYGFKRHGSQRVYPYKKRKFFYSLQSTPDGKTGGDSKGICGAPRKDTGGASSGAASQGNTFTFRESHVKLRIKSFRVPELFIELPETATVGSLKKTVMEAITTLLEGGLHIGVFVQGRKIRDDDRTLLQSGISHDNKLDSLGFTLEPKPAQVYTPTCSEEPSIDLPKPLSRLGPVACITHHGLDVSAHSQENSSASFTESERKFAPSPLDVSIEEGTADSKRLVVVPEANVQALAVVTPPQKPKRSEVAQRRIRRPFSVAEVEALVHTVENLGTGRWRDVKLRAFANAKHRTYVDLKDKWKTLVHTARIAPQQRRGEPVPQELLDRVLAAHAYWSCQQAKQQSDSV